MRNKHHKRKNILVLTYWRIDDPLITTYTLPYLRIIAKYLPAGSRIFLFLFTNSSRHPHDTRIPESNIATINTNNITVIQSRYYQFGIRAILNAVVILYKLIKVAMSERISYIHCFCMPAGCIGYIVSKLTGIPLIIDSYEPHAEPMVESNTWAKNSFAFKLLFRLEKLQSKNAVALIACVDNMKEYALEKYGIYHNDFYTKPACIDLSAFTLDRKKNKSLLAEFDLEDKVICVYAGKFGGSYLTIEVFDFFRTCVKYWGEAFRALLLTSHNKNEILNWCNQSGLEPGKVVIKYVNHKDIPDYIGLADFAISPFKPVPSKRYGTPIKTGEYWAMGLPVVIPKNISDDSDLIASTNSGAIIEHLDEVAYLKSIKAIDALLTKEKSTLLSRRIRSLAEKYRNYTIAEDIYFKLYGSDIVRKTSE